MTPESPEHLTDEQVERYRRRTLPPAELLAVDDHIAGCPTCRRRLAAGEPLAAAHAAFEAVTAPERAAARRRLAERPAARWALAAALAGAVLVGVWWLAASLGRPDREVVARSTTGEPGEPGEPGERPARTAEGNRRNGAPPEPPLRAEVAVTLADAGGSVTLDREGRLSGLGGLSPELERSIAGALAAGRLPRPAGQAGLVGSEIRLMGEGGEASAFGPLAPVATAVASPRPTFRWAPLPGADAYTVAVFDAGFDRVTASEPLPATEWTPAEPLPGGAVYTWQVTARTGAGEVTSPAPPAPEARFAVLPEARAAALERAVAGQPSRLARAVLYAREGVVDEAERELAALVEANPSSEVARSLLESVRSWKEPAAAR